MPNYANRRNTKPAVCEYCGIDLAPGEGFVYRCEAHGCKNPKHIASGGGWHVICASQLGCRDRARIRHEESHQQLSKLELSEKASAAMKKLAEAEQKPSLKLGNVAKLVSSNQGVSRLTRTRMLGLLKRCSVKSVVGLAVEIEGPDEVLGELETEPMAWALRSSVAACIALGLEEHQRVTVELVTAQREVAA